VPIPIIGDKILTHRDVNSSRPEQQATRDQSRHNASAQAPKHDSVQLSTVFTDAPIRPLSESIRSTAQAESRIQELLTNVRESPDAARKAQSSPSETQVEMLLQKTL